MPVYLICKPPLSAFQEDGENSPPGPPRGGVGSPSKNAPRNSTSSPKIKASALPNKKKKKASQAVTPVAQESATTTTSESPMHSATVTTSASTSKRTSGASSKDIEAGDAEKSTGAKTAPRDSKEGSGCWGGKGKVVVAVSRRVSVLRVSTAGSRR